MLAWVVRYTLFAMGASDAIAWMMLVGILLHGISYDFFFVTGQIYTDKVAPSQIRGQAQGMLVLFTLGFGMWIGAQITGAVEETYTPPEAIPLKEQAQELNGEIFQLKAQIRDADGPSAGKLEAQVAGLEHERATVARRAMQHLHWQKIWMIPAIGAGVIMILFALLFKDDVDVKDEVTEGDVAEAAAREELT